MALSLRPLARLLACMLPGAAALTAHSAPAVSARPANIILIVTDDLGWTDLGVQGSDFYRTPQTRSHHAACVSRPPTPPALSVRRAAPRS